VKAIEITAPGPADVLKLVERPMPAFGPGEVLIRVAASGVNRPDVLQRKGLYPVPAGASDLPGLEVAGTVVDGDRAALAGDAEHCVAPVGQCLPSPANLSDIEAASLPETFFTVWSNVFDRARLQPGETLLVHGGSSGIGVTAIQMAKAWGATVITTVGSAEKAAACRDLGADHAIDYKSQDFVLEVLRLTDGKGTDVVLDMVAGEYIGRDVKCLAEDGRIVLIAVQGGINSTIDAGLVLRRRLTITGSTLRPRPVAFKAAIAAALRKTVWPWLEPGRIKPVVYQVFPAAEAASAHALMETNQHIGKLVLAW
jgi:NADPH2:quinone reductase